MKTYTISRSVLVMQVDTFRVRAETAEEAIAVAERAFDTGSFPYTVASHVTNYLPVDRDDIPDDLGPAWEDETDG